MKTRENRGWTLMNTDIPDACHRFLSIRGSNFRDRAAPARPAMTPVSTVHTFSSSFANRAILSAQRSSGWLARFLHF
jgi:hypothetical protein